MAEGINLLSKDNRDVEEIDEKDVTRVVYIGDLIGVDLKIPDYQRPYRWNDKSVNTLFNDIYREYTKYEKTDENERNEIYRLGSVILCKKKEENNDEYCYNIVDGQQRLTTLAILLYCLGNTDTFLMKESFNSLSQNAIKNNYRILLGRIDALAGKQEQFRKFILNKCTVVKIVTDDEQTAFQFFDSQNSRGRELDPHDLLKAYHLREFGGDLTDEKIRVVNEWEQKSFNEAKNEDIKELFEVYLYPLVQWSKGKFGLNYSKKDIDTFKGISAENPHNYAKYHKASKLLFDHLKSDSPILMRYLLSKWGRKHLEEKELYQFQLTQPFIAGIRFFYFTEHYQDLLRQVREKIEGAYSKELVPVEGVGYLYVRQLFECVLLFIADRFDGADKISESTMHLSYKWCYNLRLRLTAVRKASINKYALGHHSDARGQIPLFEELSRMNAPEDLSNIINSLTVPLVEEDDIQRTGEKDLEKKMRIYNRIRERDGQKN